MHSNPRKYLEKIYDIRRNCHTVEESYSDYAAEGLLSDSLRQLIEYLHDEVVSN